MPGRKNIFTGVGEGITPTEDNMVWANLEVPGTGEHVSGALKQSGWDGTAPVATILITTEGGAIKGSQWMLRGSLGKVHLPMKRVQLESEGMDQKLAVTLDLTDLSRVTFPTTHPPGVGAPNHSLWSTGADWIDTLTSSEGVFTEQSLIKNHSFIKEKGFCLRLVNQHNEAII